MRTEPLSEEEMTERLKRAFAPRPQTKRERLATAEKPTVALAQDVTLSSDALTDRLREERQADRDRAIAQYSLDRAWEATLRVRQEISRYYKGSTTVGPNDSDANLHISPGDELWMDWRGR